jgi:mRNA interferase MazF
MNCSRNSIILLPIPFTDLSSTKVRPAIVIGQGNYPGDVFVVPITSQMSRADFRLSDWSAAGLNAPSAVKSQIATIDRQLIRKVIGTLAPADVHLLNAHLRNWLALQAMGEK